jgi:hypothetical protein
MTKKNRRILLAKIRHFRDRQWCGYLLPTEIIWLMDCGCKATKYTWWDPIKEAREQIKIGLMYGSWFYFEPTQRIVELKDEN